MSLIIITILIQSANNTKCLINNIHNNLKCLNQQISIIIRKIRNYREISKLQEKFNSKKMTMQMLSKLALVKTRN